MPTDDHFDVESCLHEAGDGKSLSVSWPEFSAGIGKIGPDLQPWRVFIRDDGALFIESRGFNVSGWDLKLLIPGDANPIVGNAVYDSSSELVQTRARAVWTQMMKWAVEHASPHELEGARTVSTRASAYNLAVWYPGFLRLAAEFPLAAAVLHDRSFKKFREEYDHEQAAQLSQTSPLEVVRAAAADVTTKFDEAISVASTTNIAGFATWLSTVRAAYEYGMLGEFPALEVSELAPLVIPHLSPTRVEEMGQTYGPEEWYVFHSACRVNPEIADLAIRQPAKVIDILRHYYTPEHWLAANDHRHLYDEVLERLKSVQSRITPSRLQSLVNDLVSRQDGVGFQEFAPSPVDGLQFGLFKLVQLRNTDMLRGSSDSRNTGSASGLAFENERCAAGEMWFNVMDSAGDLVVTLRMSSNLELIESSAPGGVSMRRFAEQVTDIINAELAKAIPRPPRQLQEHNAPRQSETGMQL